MLFLIKQIKLQLKNKDKYKSMYCQNNFNHISMAQRCKRPHNRLEFYTQFGKFVFMTRVSFIYLRQFLIIYFIISVDNKP